MRDEENISSEIIGQVIKINLCNSEKATHFALCNGAKIRYIISINGGRSRLVQNFVAYSKKLTLLMILMKYIPLVFFKTIKLGYFVNIELCEEVKNVIAITDTDNWNLLVGAYDEYQKLVFQCFKKKRKKATYVKVGNISSNINMNTEIDFLVNKKSNELYSIPTVLYSHKINKIHKFNIMITNEIIGTKVRKDLNSEIYNIFKEISGNKRYVNDILYSNSHGDFTPWNMRLYEDKYIVFDWEHYDYRFYGYDLIHYVYMVEKKLHNSDTDKALEIAVDCAQSFDELLYSINKNVLKSMYLETVINTLGHE